MKQGYELPGNQGDDTLRLSAFSAALGSGSLLTRSIVYEAYLIDGRDWAVCRFLTVGTTSLSVLKPSSSLLRYELFSFVSNAWGLRCDIGEFHDIVEQLLSPCASKGLFDTLSEWMAVLLHVAETRRIKTREKRRFINERHERCALLCGRNFHGLLRAYEWHLGCLLVERCTKAKGSFQMLNTILYTYTVLSIQR